MKWKYKYPAAIVQSSSKNKLKLPAQDGFTLHGEVSHQESKPQFFTQNRRQLRHFGSTAKYRDFSDDMLFYFSTQFFFLGVSYNISHFMDDCQKDVKKMLIVILSWTQSFVDGESIKPQINTLLNQLENSKIHRNSIE